MSYIKRANVKMIYSGSGEAAARFSFYLDKGQTVSADMAFLTNDLLIDQDLVWFEGVGVDDDFIEVAQTVFMENAGKDLAMINPLLVGLAAAKILAVVYKKELYEVLADYYEGYQPKMPVPIFNLFNGGKFGDTDLDFDEYLLMPSLHNKESVREKIKTVVAIRREVGKALIRSNYDIDIGLFGGFAPDIASSLTVFEIISAACLKNGWSLPESAVLGVAVGAHHLYDTKSHTYLFSLDRHHLSGMSLTALYSDWLAKYSVHYLEDPVAPVDEESWKKISVELRNKILIAGDALVEKGQDELREIKNKKIANTVVVKPMRFKSLAEMKDFVLTAKKYNYAVLLAADINETEDTWLSDLAAGWPVDLCKFGSLARSERVAKYNRLIEIEEALLTDI